MPSTKKFIQRDKMVAGMSSLPAHLIDDNKWGKAFNVSFNAGRCTQVPRQVLVAALQPGAKYNIQNLVSIPTEVRANEALYALTERHAWQLKYTADFDTITGLVPFNIGLEYAKWATVLFGDRLYFSNPSNYLRYIHDGVVYAHGEGDQPSAKYLGVYYDHLIAANVTMSGNNLHNRIMWSGLSKFGTWVATHANEADHYDCLENSSLHPNSQRITGAATLKDIFVVYTPEVIYTMEYKGLPTVMKTSPNYWCGPDLDYSLIARNEAHFFINYLQKDIYRFDGQNHTSIGADIDSFFFADLSASPSLRQKTWGYYDETTTELVWCYCSTTSTGLIDRCVRYNTTTKAWSFGSCNNLHSYCGAGRTFRPVGDLPDPIPALTGMTMGNVGCTVKEFANLWGGGNTCLYREQIAGDPIAILQPQAVPYLETGDIDYDNYQNVKEWETMAIQAASLEGILVEVSVRDQYTTTPTWVTVATFLGTEKEKRVSAPRKSGRVIRFRFTAKTTEVLRSWTLQHGEEFDYVSMLRTPVADVFGYPLPTP